MTKLIHTILTTDKDGKEYRVPFLHDINDKEHAGYLCKGCNRMFTYKTKVEDKLPTLIGYLWSEKMQYWEKVEFCNECVKSEKWVT